jgi:3-oxoacyl-[acyl-carrier protein] reductase
MIEMIALGRYGQGDEVAGMVSDLASSEAAFVTGRVSKLMAALPLPRKFSHNWSENSV